MTRKLVADLINFIQKLTPSFCFVSGLLIVILIGIFDNITGQYVPFYVLYLMPVLFVTASFGYRGGVIISFFAAVVWFVADHLPMYERLEFYRPIINGFIGIIAFLIPSIILSILIDVLLMEKKYARTDPLTGIANLREFNVQLDRELERIKRYGSVFSMAYMDLDNFKSINDQYGHSTGDKVLKQIVSAIRDSIRINDNLARLGGDEFGLLLPETGTKSAMEIIQRLISKVEDICKLNEWPVGISVGIVTCSNSIDRSDKIIGMADKLMYQAKNNGCKFVHKEFF